MKRIIQTILACLGIGGAASAATRYVDANSASPAPPFTSWATAAKTIQDGVDAASPGDTILVTNGVYSSGGGRTVLGTVTNRVAVNKVLNIQSVNGPAFTLIQGRQVPGTTNGDSAVRCVYLTNGASLSGFTLTNGATRSVGDPNYDQSGGGAFAGGAMLSNCVIVGNSAAYQGGGVAYGTLYNCTLMQNSAVTIGGGTFYSTAFNCVYSRNWAAEGGGSAGFGVLLNGCVFTANSAYTGSAASFGILNNCTVTGNSNVPSSNSGALDSCSANNCIVYFNTGFRGNYYRSTLNYCCTTPPPPDGNGNFTVDPQLASDSHLSAGSPCRTAGISAYSPSFDIDGESWSNPPSIGCDEYHAGAVTGPLSVALTASRTNVLTEDLVNFVASIAGRTSDSAWNFGDGVIVSNEPYATHTWTVAGDYTVVLTAFNESQPSGISANFTIHVSTRPVHYVNAAGVNPVSPFTSWPTAATNIQDAVDAAAVPGALILVTNGTYASGGRPAVGLLTNRVAVNKPVIVRSVNGPQVTFIQGRQLPGATNGDGAIRCVYLTNGASLSGFTLTNGATRSSGTFPDDSGGGVFCDPSGPLISNCVLQANCAASSGGGAWKGQLANCSVNGNCAVFGAGIFGGTANYCTITGNSAATNGGGVVDSQLNNCLLASNSAVNGSGGGLYFSFWFGATNCTIVNNSAVNGGGVYSYTNGLFANCIIYANLAPTGSNYFSPWYPYGIALYYCCTAPQPAGQITDDPLFVDLTGGNFRLQPHSPCIDAGNNGYAPPGPDLDSKPRIVDGNVDIGAFEYQNSIPPYFLLEPVDQTTTAGLEITFSANAKGTRPLHYQWRFNDVNIAGATNTSFTLNHARLSDAGYYSVSVANDAASIISREARLIVNPSVTHYADAANQNPVSPYTSWSTAATNIQDAIDAAAASDEIVVTNGVYSSGGRIAFGFITTNRICADKPLHIRSVNGPRVTTIVGKQVAGTTNGDGAIRCAFLTNGSSLIGFTLTNGGTSTNGQYGEQSGGGVFAGSVVISNCIVVGNSCNAYGGGAYGGAFYNSLILRNTANNGGGAWSSLANCTVVSNSAPYAGGASGGWITNCIIYYNTAANYPNWQGGNLDHCCTTPLPTSGNVNFTNLPAFANPAIDDYHLAAGSPCINAGINAAAPGAIDLDGNPRLVNGTVDIGAYEFQGPGSVISYAWLQGYGFLTDGSADYADSDGDGMNNWQEWIAGTNPTNAASALSIVSATPVGNDIQVMWQSVLGIGYFLQRSTNLTPSPNWTTIVTNLPGQSTTTGFTDKNAALLSPLFYRVGVAN